MGITDLNKLINNPLFDLAVIADLVLKGIGMWKAGRNNQMYWFIAMLVINSAGILPLIYILGFQQKRK